MICHAAALLPSWLLELPSPWSEMLTWLLSPAVLTFLAVSSVTLFLLSAAGLPWFLARIPADYFTRHELRELGLRRPRQPWWRMALRLLRNAIGLVLLVAGVAMLLLPGQGLLTIFAALFLLDFPGKRRFQRWLVQRDTVFRGLNAIRRRMGAEPFRRAAASPEKPEEG